MDIGTHEHTIVGGYTEECDEAHPHGDGEVDLTHAKHVAKIDAGDGEVEEPRLTIEPHEDETTCKSDEDTREMDERGCYTLELKIEDEQDEQQSYRDDDAQSLGGMYLLFITSGEAVAHAFRKIDLVRSHELVDMLLCRVDHVDLCLLGVTLVEGDVTYEERVLRGDHGSTRRESD